MIAISGQKCLMCGDIIYSRTEHDFHYCFCGNIYVDGGPAFTDEENYSRVGYSFAELYETVIVNLDIDEYKDKTKFVLRQDWGQDINKYGVMEDANYTNEMRIAAKAKIKLLEK